VQWTWKAVWQVQGLLFFYFSAKKYEKQRKSTKSKREVFCAHGPTVNLSLLQLLDGWTVDGPISDLG